MKIRRLEIQGFKSFAERTRFDFGDGISSIVGPNGCGKSNVVDAVKWVLGDMSPRSLRGKRMEDVIFAGSRHRRPLGLAEVTLVLENGEGVMRTERHEVAITRRLHRNGLSEYFVCGEKARLKDIRELLLDTGLGANGNAIMEQGQIDALLAANPQDRRGVFEEAAGVSRYKQRRKEAEQRLHRTQENLERLLDVLELEEKRLRSLKNQAGRARRYQEIKRELARKRVLRAVLRYRVLHRERTRLQENLRLVLQREQEAAAELAALEDRSREAEQERIQAREAVHTEETRISEAAGEIRAAEERIAFLRRSREELAERIVQAREEGDRTLARAAELETEREALETEIAQGEAATEEELGRLEAAEVELRRLEREVGRIRDAYEARKGEIVGLLGLVSESRNVEAGHRADLRQIEGRIGRLGRQREELSAQLGAVTDELQALGLEASRLETETRECQGGLARSVARRDELATRSREARVERARIREERATKAARLDVLERLAAAREGLDAGTRAVLEEVEARRAEGPDGDQGGILGVLADLVRPSPEDGARLDRLLGFAAAALVVRTAADAVRWIEWLRTHHDNARARFLCLDLVGADVPRLPEDLGSLGCASDLEALVTSVVTGTQLVDDLETGIARWRAQRTNAVTRTGDRVTSSGALLGGADGQVLGLVERTAEMHDLSKQVADLDRQLVRAAGEVDRARAELEGCESEIEALRGDLAHRAEARSRGAEAVARASRERDRLIRALDLVEVQFLELVEALEDAHEAASIAGRHVEGLDERRHRLEAEAEEAAGAYRDAERAHREAADRRMEVRLALAEARARREAARGRAERAGAEARASRERAAALAAEGESLSDRRDQSEVEITESEARAARAEEERRAAGAHLVRAREELAALELAASGEVARQREIQDLHEDLRRRLEDFRLKDSELRVRLESLVERVRQDEGLELEDVERETAAADDLDVDAMDEEVEVLRRRLEGLGNVNLNAIAELEEVQERVDFLQGQQRDLLDGKANLERAITELNDLTTTRFAETFERIREHFRETFRRLFGGGRAEIILEDASNLLESGVDIVARPPGKEQRTISLLSGGERTLTAVALLFAVFKAKPSPFAILDEVDAALDEANVRRLIGLIREFTDRSQFLMVTHAKTTMEAADLLYGVTMEEPGVSKKVAVQLTEYPAEVLAG